ncbi:MAG: hypothetical protein GY850_46110, partial [bacterium]|nr:hypothetical protein [bacterium]
MGKCTYRFIVVAVVMVLCSGCGYRLATPDGPLLDTVSTIAVPYFKNKTFEPGAEALFTAAFV